MARPNDKDFRDRLVSYLKAESDKSEGKVFYKSFIEIARAISVEPIVSDKEEKRLNNKVWQYIQKLEDRGFVQIVSKGTGGKKNGYKIVDEKITQALQDEFEESEQETDDIILKLHFDLQLASKLIASKKEQHKQNLIRIKRLEDALLNLTYFGNNDQLKQAIFTTPNPAEINLLIDEINKERAKITNGDNELAAATSEE